MHVVSINVGLPKALSIHGREVETGFFKTAVSGPVAARRLNLEGDEQADLSVHGGPDKAVYLYPADHWRWWEREHGLACAPASFGENLTLEGIDETRVAIGDRFRWGEAMLE